MSRDRPSLERCSGPGRRRSWAPVVLPRHRYSDRRPREQYQLTDVGRDLAPTLLALEQWGIAGVGTGTKRRSSLTAAHVDHVCSTCGEIVAVDDLEITAVTAPPIVTTGVR
ncbi:winged helix-turn-helix transcriptional regulator [Nocardia salmonicida]|uniref:winged helix-turn-helix transcriptional regulator n=1 Tax=Nocardia salmonicida TaxID=53431 RepID=UPI003795BB5E